MSHHNTASVTMQDRFICRTVFGFLTAPLIILTMAGTIIAL